MNIINYCNLLTSPPTEDCLTGILVGVRMCASSCFALKTPTPPTLLLLRLRYPTAAILFRLSLS